MSDNNSPWGPKPGSGNNGGKGGGNSPWGNGGGQRPNKPKRPGLDNVEKFRPRSGGGGNRGGGSHGGNGQLPDFNIPSWAFIIIPIVYLFFASVFTVQGNQEGLGQACMLNFRTLLNVRSLKKSRISVKHVLVSQVQKNRLC